MIQSSCLDTARFGLDKREIRSWFEYHTVKTTWLTRQGEVDQEADGNEKRALVRYLERYEFVGGFLVPGKMKVLGLLEAEEAPKRKEEAVRNKEQHPRRKGDNKVEVKGLGISLGEELGDAVDVGDDWEIL